MFTFKEAAAELHMSIRQVQRLVEAGDLETVGEAPDRLIKDLSLAQVKHHTPRPSFPAKSQAIPTIVAGIYAKWPDPPIIYPAKWPDNPTWRWELAKVQDPVDDDVPEILPPDGTPWDSKYYALVRSMSPKEIEVGKKLYSFESAGLGIGWAWVQLPDME